MFDVNSPAALEARNRILKGLGAEPVHYNCRCNLMPEALYVERVIYNDPATIVYWSDKTRTVVKCQPGDKFDFKLGFLLALCKRVCGNNGRFNDLLRDCVPGYGEEEAPEDGHE